MESRLSSDGHKKWPKERSFIHEDGERGNGERTVNIIDRLIFRAAAGASDRLSHTQLIQYLETCNHDYVV